MVREEESFCSNFISYHHISCVQESIFLRPFQTHYYIFLKIGYRCIGKCEREDCIAYFFINFPVHFMSREENRYCFILCFLMKNFNVQKLVVWKGKDFLRFPLIFRESTQHFFYCFHFTWLLWNIF